MPEPGVKISDSSQISGERRGGTQWVHPPRAGGSAGRRPGCGRDALSVLAARASRRTGLSVALGRTP